VRITQEIEPLSPTSREYGLTIGKAKEILTRFRCSPKAQGFGNSRMNQEERKALSRMSEPDAIDHTADTD
jgi:hypothetical protein